jgi:catechol 2,3-dioxygenase-like lactoylglutathione lyase family enzyme
MLDHVGIPVSDYARAKTFYALAFKPLGYDLVLEVSSRETGGESHAGFGTKGRPQFWIGGGKPISGRVHFAFVAKNRAAVDNGPPGLRPHYHANYYGAFVLDPDGHNIEAVCHLPPV